MTAVSPFRPDCADCGEAPAAGQTTVYVLHLKSGHHLTLCRPCAWARVPKDYAWGARARPCEGGCGLAVKRSATIHGRVLCSPTCGRLDRYAVRNERRRQQPLPARQCAGGCGCWFTPERSDHRFHPGHEMCRARMSRRERGEGNSGVANVVHLSVRTASDTGPAPKFCPCADTSGKPISGVYADGERLRHVSCGKLVRGGDLHVAA
jgi:hypothetical protein